MTNKKEEYKERIELAKGLYNSQKEEWDHRFPILKEMSEKKAIRSIAKVVKMVIRRWSE